MPCGCGENNKCGFGKHGSTQRGGVRQRLSPMSKVERSVGLIGTFQHLAMCCKKSYPHYVCSWQLTEHLVPGIGKFTDKQVLAELHRAAFAGVIQKSASLLRDEEQSKPLSTYTSAAPTETSSCFSKRIVITQGARRQWEVEHCILQTSVVHLTCGESGRNVHGMP